MVAKSDICYIIQWFVYIFAQVLHAAHPRRLLYCLNGGLLLLFIGLAQVVGALDLL
jgi:hypothetical protein